MRRISRQSARQPPKCDAAMPLEALLFDVDGTLAETEEAHRQSFNEAFTAFGLDWRWNKELYRELLQVTGGKERLHFGGREAIDASLRMDRGLVERLVGVEVPDPGYDVLRHQE